MKEERIFSIYCHTNKINNKKYIGITSKEPKIRWNNGLGYKKGQYFYKAIEKYGWDGFEHEVLYSNMTKEEAQLKEIELIKKYKTNKSDFGYNRTKGGEFDNESRKIKINQYDLNGNYIKTWDSIKDICLELNCERSTINRCCNGKQKFLYNKYIFRYYNGNTDDILIEEYINSNSKKIGKYNKNGDLIKIYDSVINAVKEFGNSGIYNCAQGKSKTCGGYIWKYI